MHTISNVLCFHKEDKKHQPEKISHPNSQQKTQLFTLPALPAPNLLTFLNGTLTLFLDFILKKKSRGGPVAGAQSSQC